MPSASPRRVYVRETKQPWMMGIIRPETLTHASGDLTIDSRSRSGEHTETDETAIRQDLGSVSKASAAASCKLDLEKHGRIQPVESKKDASGSVPMTFDPIILPQYQYQRPRYL